MRSSILVSGLITAALLTAGAATAGESEYPVAFVERPLTLPRFTLAPQGEIDIDRISISALVGGGTLVSNSVVIAGMQLGASFGITPDLEVGAIVLPIQFNNGAGYGGIFVGEEGTLAQSTLFATYRFLNQPSFDLGARLRVQIFAPHGSGVAGGLVEPSVPFLLHIGKVARFDAEVGIPITAVRATVNVKGVATTSSTHASVGLDVPLKLAFNIIEPLHVGVSTGLRVEDFSDGADTTVIPLGVFAGYAVGEKRPIVDIDPFFSFFQFLTPGVSGPGTDKVNPGIFVAGVSVKGFIYF